MVWKEDFTVLRNSSESKFAEISIFSLFFRYYL
jgi:hypothetical protein